MLGRANHAPTQTQNSKPSKVRVHKVQRVDIGGEGEDVKYGAENGPSKVTKHFSLLLDNLKLAKFISTAFYLKSPKINAYQIVWYIYIRS